MKTLIVSILLILLAGCLDETTIGKPIDVELQPYVNAYLKHCKMFKHYCKVKTGVVFASNLLYFQSRYLVVPEEMPTRTLGVTFYHFDTIFISAKAWRRLNETERHFLIYHELGHAHLNRRHLDTEYKGYKLSIMTTYMLNFGTMNAELKAAYIAELFTGNVQYLKDVIDNK